MNTITTILTVLGTAVGILFAIGFILAAYLFIKDILEDGDDYYGS